MEDYRIVDLYWARDEAAITASEEKYGRMLYALSYSLLSSHEDAEECVNDTYLGAWNTMPTERPARLAPYLSKITRRISIDKWRHDHREKRGGLAVMEELDECIPSTETPAEQYENGRLTKELNLFLAGLSREKRAIFLRRYFYSQSVEFIAASLGIGESKVKVTLHRLREALRKRLEGQELL